MYYETISSKAALDEIFTSLAKAYRHLAKKHAVPLEIIIIGGASILLNYGFRESTYDVDAMIPKAHVLKEAIKQVAETHRLEPKWLNMDFEKTTSYSKQLIEHSKFYKTYLGLLEVRTIKDEHLIAMKLKASREYKYDLSDVVGILSECTKRGLTIDKSIIEKAVIDLYGSLNQVKDEAWERLDLILDNLDFEFLYEAIREEEKSNRQIELMKQSKGNQVPKEDNTELLLSLLEKE